MSVDSYRNRLSQLNRDKANLEKSLSREKDNIYRIRREINNIQRSITRNTSLSTLQSKQRQIESKERQLANYEKRVADYEKRIADKVSEIARTLQNLERTEDQENRRKEREEKKKRDDELRHARTITRELERQTRLQKEIGSSRLVIDLTKLPEKITILFCATNPEDQSHLKLDEEIRLITQKIRAAEFRDSIDLRSIWALRPTDLLQALNEHKPTILHFSGHGSDQDEVIFQDDTGASKPVSKSAIVEMFKIVSSGTRLVVFNTCFSKTQAEEVTEHIEAAIGMNTSIGDEAARVFAAHFYSAIGFGKNVKESFNQARVALMLEGIKEEQTPELFTRPEVDPKNLILVKPEGGKPGNPRAKVNPRPWDSI